MTIHRIRKTLAELGFANGLLYLLNRFLQKASGGKAFIVRYHFVAQPVPSSVASSVRSSPKSRVRAIDPEDPLIPAFPRPAQVIDRRFRDGAICFVAESNDEFAGYLWLTRNSYDEDEVRCRYQFSPPELCAWDYDVYVAPKFRIGRTFIRLWDAANAYLSDRGVQWSLSRISSFNIASIAAHQRLGTEILCSACFIVVGPVQLSILPAYPWIHLSIGPSNRPTIWLKAPNEVNSLIPKKKT